MPSSYKRRKKIWKSVYLLIIVGILYIGYILIKSGYINEENDINVTKKSLKDTKNFDLKYNIILKDSIFEGVNKNLNAYKIKTERAIKESDNKYKLDIINAIYNVNQDQTLIINAKEGFLDEESNILDLKNDVKLFFDEIIFNTNDASIDLVNKNITGNSSAKLLYKNSSITSDSFNTKDENNIIIFKGNVSTISISIYANDKNISNLHITSDTLIIDRIKQKAEYLGNVVVYFDNAILRTKELYIFYKTIDDKQTIDYIVIPTKLTVERKINNELLLADSAKYFFDDKQLILLGNVILQRDDNVLKTNKLIYYVDIVKK